MLESNLTLKPSVDRKLEVQSDDFTVAVNTFRKSVREFTQAVARLDSVVEAYIATQGGNYEHSSDPESGNESGEAVRTADGDSGRLFTFADIGRTPQTTGQSISDPPIVDGTDEAS